VTPAGGGALRCCRRPRRPDGPGDNRRHLPWRPSSSRATRPTRARTPPSARCHEMVTGKKAFEGKSPASLITAIMDPSRLRWQSPAGDAAAARSSGPALCCEGPDDRWQSASDVMRESWLTEGSPSAPAAGRAKCAHFEHRRLRMDWPRRLLPQALVSARCGPATPVDRRCIAARS
jgi:hypothetical protein